MLEQPYESIEEEEFDEDLDVEASISPPLEDKGMVSCTPFSGF